MRWLIGLVAALATFGSAHATVFYVSESVAPIPGTTYVDVSFPDVDLHPGDSLELTITVDAAWIAALPPECCASFVSFNIPYGPLPGGLDHIHYCNYTCFGPELTQTVSAYVDGTVQSEFADLNYYTASLVPFPEPSAWTLMLLGVLSAGAALRRRARSAFCLGRRKLFGRVPVRLSLAPVLQTNKLESHRLGPVRTLSERSEC
jgi:hypothetical protein